ncbi:MAG: hypothetical protein ACTSYS_13950 [Promethearchaeota archaeon]
MKILDLLRLKSRSRKRASNALFLTTIKQKGKSKHFIDLNIFIRPGKFLQEIMPGFVEIHKWTRFSRKTEKVLFKVVYLYIKCSKCNKNTVLRVFREDKAWNCDEDKEIDPASPAICELHESIESGDWYEIYKIFKENFPNYFKRCIT